MGLLATNLGEERLVVAVEGVEIAAEGVVGSLEGRVVALELLGLPPSAAVLEPDGDLARVQAELVGQPSLALGLKFVLLLEVFVQSSHLIFAQSPLLGRPFSAGLFLDQ